MTRVCVFAGSSTGARPEYRAAAEDLGRVLARRGVGVVYGGARVGLMGAVADAALAAGGRVIGVIPSALAAKEIAHGGLTELHVVSSMHERKALMADLADAFVAVPGGWGTCEELFEIVTWAQLGIHRKPCGILNVDGYYDPLLTLFDRAVDEDFVQPANRRLVLENRDPNRLLDVFAGYAPTKTETWISRDDT